MHKKYFFVLAALVAGNPAIAQEFDTGSATLGELAQECVERIDGNGDIAEIADELLGRSSRDIERGEVFNSLRCLSIHFGERYFVNPDNHMFISQTADQERLRALRLAEEEERRREEEAQQALRALREERALEEAIARREFLRAYEERLENACYDELRRNALNALTTSECVEIFEESGFDR